MWILRESFRGAGGVRLQGESPADRPQEGDYASRPGNLRTSSEALLKYLLFNAIQ